MNLQQAKQIWDQACQRRVLICNADVPMGYQFQYAAFRHSLAADYYLERLLNAPESAGSTIDRLRRMNVDDFTKIVIFMVHRLCGIEPEAGGSCSGKEREALYTLCQGISAYAWSLTNREDVYKWEDVYKCCLALENILRGDYSRNLLSICNCEGELYHCRCTLLNSYAQLYRSMRRNCAAEIGKLSAPESLDRSEWGRLMV